MKERIWNLTEKLVLGFIVLYVADAIFQPYAPKPVATPSKPLEIIWTNPVL